MPVTRQFQRQCTLPLFKGVYQNKIHRLLYLFAVGLAEIGSVNHLILMWLGEKEKVETSLSGLQQISAPHHLLFIDPLYCRRSIGLFDKWGIAFGFYMPSSCC